MLCAEVSHQNSNGTDYDFIVCDLPTGKNATFLTEANYNEYAKLNGLPKKSEFYDFKTHYKEYFDKQSKWKKWLLP